MDKKFIFRNSVLTLFALLITVIIFVIDLKAEPEITVSGMYVIVILYVFILQWKYISIIFGILISGLMVYSYSQNIQINQNLSLNFIISISGLWVSVILVNLAHKGFDFVDGFQKNLENEVKKRTSEIRRYESKIRMMTNEIKDQAIILINHKGHIETWNIGAQYIFGFSEQNALSMNFGNLISESNKEFGGSLNLFEIQNDTRLKLWLKREDNSSFYARLSVNPIKFESTITAYTLIINDLSDLRALELESKNKELESFAYIVAHDLRAPVNSISGLLDLIETENKKGISTNSNSYLLKIKQSTIRMRGLINGILEFSRLGNEKSFKSIDINKILEYIEDDLHSLIEETGASINYKKMPFIIANELEMRILFQNIISNALKFRKENISPNITISIDEKENFWKFSIADNGLGIPYEKQEDIFKIFYRFHESRNIEGSGIGLSKCKKIVTLHRGDIWVESEINIGTTFFFTIARNLF